MLIAALLLAALACTRSNVPQPGGVGSGGMLQPTQVATEAPTVTPVPQATQVPSTATPLVPQPLVSPTYPPTPTAERAEPTENILYVTQPGDVLRNVAVRFAVLPSDIISPEGPLPGEQELLSPDQILFIPRRLGPTGPADKLIPDSELVFSPHAIDFDLEALVAGYDGYLARYRETVGGFNRSGAEVVALAARDHSVNPRLLLALLEFQSHWLTSSEWPVGNAFTYPMGHESPDAQGLYRQLTWLANELGNGYYGWRDGSLTELVFPDSSVMRLAPELNAGTVALQYYFSLSQSGRDWAATVSDDGFIETYRLLFGDPFDYSHPLYESGLEQPEMILPFLKGRIWALTGGPHGAWEAESAWAALDFAPSTLLPGCAESEDWVLAAAPGLVVRTGHGVVVLDLDGDGEEQSGWSLLYLHIGREPAVREGDLVEQGDFIGHPSCEGGVASGTHVHIARKYNGEWILADGPIPFTLSGWVAKAGVKPYQGALTNGEQEVLACQCASQETYISR